MLITVDKETTASYDIDCQNAFTPVCPNELPTAGGTEIVDELNQQARFATYRLGSKDAHSPQAIWVADDEHPQGEAIEGDNVDVRWVAHAVPGTQGFELIKGLPKVTDYDFFVWKGIELDMHPYGNCFHDFDEKMSTGLIEFLRNHGVKTVIAGGLVTDYCVKNTVLQLLKADFEVIVNLGACRGIAKETTQAAIEEMKKCGARFIDSAQALKA